MKVRECYQEDYPNLVEFWNENSGWDSITQETWEDRFIKAPFGPSEVVVIEDNNVIIAQLIFIYLKINLGDKIVLGCRPFAAVISSSARGLKAYKYIIQLYIFGKRLMKQKGCDLLLMLPDPRWKPISKFTDTIPFEFPLYKKELIDQNKIGIKDGFNTFFIDFDHPEIADIWKAVSNQNMYMVSRDQETLKWKNSHRGYKIIGVFNEERLIGVGTILEKVQEKQIQICDLLYANEEAKGSVLDHLSKFINTTYMKDQRFYKMVILAIDSFQKPLLSSGYVQDDYKFLFVISRLNKKLSKETINISKWYIAAND